MRKMSKILCELESQIKNAMDRDNLSCKITERFINWHMSE